MNAKAYLFLQNLALDSAQLKQAHCKNLQTYGLPWQSTYHSALTGNLAPNLETSELHLEVHSMPGSA